MPYSRRIVFAAEFRRERLFWYDVKKDAPQGGANTKGVYL
jgi:hypothetical protein